MDLLATARRLFRGGAPGTYLLPPDLDFVRGPAGARAASRARIARPARESLTRGFYTSLAAKEYVSLAHTDRDLDETPHGLRQEPGGRRLTAQPEQE